MFEPPQNKGNGDDDEYGSRKNTVLQNLNSAKQDLDDMSPTLRFERLNDLYQAD